MIKSYNNNRLVFTGKVIQVVYHNDNYYSLIVNIYNYNCNIPVMGYLSQTNYINNITVGTPFFIYNIGINLHYDINSIHFVTDTSSFLFGNDLKLIDHLYQVDIYGINISNKVYKSIIYRINHGKGTDNDIFVKSQVKLFLSNNRSSNI